MARVPDAARGRLGEAGDQWLRGRLADQAQQRYQDEKRREERQHPVVGKRGCPILQEVIAALPHRSLAGRKPRAAAKRCRSFRHMATGLIREQRSSGHQVCLGSEGLDRLAEFFAGALDLPGQCLGVVRRRLAVRRIGALLRQFSCPVSLAGHLHLGQPQLIMDEQGNLLGYLLSELAS